MAQCATTALADAVPRPCVRGARGRFGGAQAGTWCCVSPVSPFPPRVSRAVFRGPSRPGVPYPRSLVRHSTQSMLSAGSVRLPFWYSPRALCVCVRSRSRGVRFPPPLPMVVWRAHLAWSRRWALVGPFHAVRAPPRVLPRSLAPSGVLGGGRPAPVCLLPGLGLRAPRGVGLCVRGVPAPGGGVGMGGRPVRRAPHLCGRGGQWGGGSLCLVPSLCLPWAGNKANVTGVILVMEGVAPIPLWFVLACRLWARPVWRPGALVRVRLFPAVPVGAGGWGGGAGLAPAPLPGAAVLPGGWGPAALRFAGRLGGWGGGRAAAFLLSLWGAAHGSLPCPPSRRRRIPPQRVRSVGVVGPPRAPGAACLAGGGGRGGSCTACPGALSDSSPPSALLEWATLRVSPAMLWPWGARPAYCSGSSPRAAPSPGPRAAPARWCGVARRPQPPREQAAGGAGARGVRVQLPPPLRVAVPSGGGGASPRFRGGGGSALLRPAGRGGGGGGGGGAAPPYPAPLPRRVSACQPLSPARPPGVYSCCGAGRAAVGLGRGPVGHQ